MIKGTDLQNHQQPLYLMVIHESVAGRTRLKVPGLYRNDKLRNGLESHLLGMDDVRSARANTLTGNLVIEYVAPQALENFLQEIIRFLELEFGQPVLRSTEGIDRPLKKFRTVKSVKKLQAQIAAEKGEYQAQARHFWHVLPGDRVLEILGSTENGLSTNNVAQRLAQFGPNTLTEYKSRSALHLFLQQFVSAPVAMLGISAVISVATGGIADATVIVTVAVINAVIGYFTEKSAEETINALGHLTPETATVIRSGVAVDVSLQELVVGDILVLVPGVYIPADARLLDSNRLTIDESALTGESMPVAKAFNDQCDNDTAIGDRLNMVYMGTTVTGGNGKAVVVGTGRYTEIGEIHALVGETQAPVTPMQKQINAMDMLLAFLSSGVCVFVFTLGLLRGRSWLEMLRSAIALAVAAFPEGLPAVATTTLALGIKNMQRQKVLIRKLPAIENLGSLQVICLDKTGTLTLNKMSVVDVQLLTGHIKVENGRFYRNQETADFLYGRDPIFKRMLKVLVLCNESRLVADKIGLIGSPTENALLQVAIDAGVDVQALRTQYPVIKTEHRAEDRPYMVTIHHTSDGKYFVAVKGSPISLLDLCLWHGVEDQLMPLTDIERRIILTGNEKLGGDTLRVLGVAYCLVDDMDSYRRQALIWLGLIGMEDMMRPGMVELMREFHDAGIATVMITGDQSATAYSVGKRLGLNGEGEALEMVDSIALEKLHPSVLAGLVDKVSIFSRVSPAHKLRIVEALQQNGKVVAMTGDGINDGPALKAANVGVTLGDKGSDAARSVSAVVLEDDDLSTMIGAIRQGRTIYDNIRKSLHFLLSTNLSEIEVTLLSTAFGGAEILNPMQLLWIDLFTDIFPGLALALEPPECDVMDRPPRDPKEPIVSSKDYAKLLRESSIISAGSLAVYSYSRLRYGTGPKAGTNAFMSLTLGQLIHAYSCRSGNTSLFDAEERESNPYLDAAIGISVALQVLAVTVPALRRLLRLTPIGSVDVLAILAGASLPLAINEATKKLDGDIIFRSKP